MTAGAADDCAGHGGLSAEARALALSVLDRIEPVLQRLRTEQPTPVTDVCGGCPVCAVLAALRGDRPELAVRLAQQTAGIVAVLRAALEEGDPGASPSGAQPPAEPARSSRAVQRIPVARATTRR